jgi:hypothetical protein
VEGQWQTQLGNTGRNDVPQTSVQRTRSSKERGSSSALDKKKKTNIDIIRGRAGKILNTNTIVDLIRKQLDSVHQVVGGRRAEEDGVYPAAAAVDTATYSGLCWGRDGKGPKHVLAGVRQETSMLEICPPNNDGPCSIVNLPNNNVMKDNVAWLRSLAMLEPPRKRTSDLQQQQNDDDGKKAVLTGIRHQVQNEQKGRELLYQLYNAPEINVLLENSGGRQRATPVDANTNFIAEKHRIQHQASVTETFPKAKSLIAVLGPRQLQTTALVDHWTLEEQVQRQLQSSTSSALADWVPTQATDPRPDKLPCCNGYFIGPSSSVLEQQEADEGPGSNSNGVVVAYNKADDLISNNQQSVGRECLQESDAPLLAAALLDNLDEETLLNIVAQQQRDAPVLDKR